MEMSNKPAEILDKMINITNEMLIILKDKEIAELKEENENLKKQTGYSGPAYDRICNNCGHDA